MDLKINFGEDGSPHRGKILMRPSLVDGQEHEYVEVPVLVLNLALVPQEIPTITAKFLVTKSEAVIKMANLIQGEIVTSHCFYCRERLVKTHYQREDGSWMMCWLCNCEHDPDVEERAAEMRDG
jgi:hypothetical protein